MGNVIVVAAICPSKSVFEPVPIADTEGLSVCYEVFPGNMYEGDTFKQAIEKIKNLTG